MTDFTSRNDREVTCIPDVARFPEFGYRIGPGEGQVMGQEPTKGADLSTAKPIQDLLGDEPVSVENRPPFSLRKTGHDLRNALNVIRNASYLLRRKLVAAGGEHVDLVDMIEDSVKSAEVTVTAIMEYAIRSGEPPASGTTPGPK